VPAASKGSALSGGPVDAPELACDTAGVDVDRETLLTALRTALGSGPSLRLAVLFGSFARGQQRPGSDIDVAILPVDADLPLGAELDLQVALELACGRAVDLVRLDRASTMLRFRIAREGVALLAEPAFEHPRFVAAAAAEHAEFAPALAVASERFRQRVAAGAVDREGERR
jgi:predicted nucleotidyltransferase